MVETITLQTDTQLHCSFLPHQLGPLHDWEVLKKNKRAEPSRSMLIKMILKCNLAAL